MPRLSIDNPIEVIFMGLGGAGKTSIITSLVSNLKEKKVDVLSPLDLKNKSFFEKYFISPFCVFNKQGFKGLLAITKLFFLIKPFSYFTRQNFYILIQNFIAKQFIFSKNKKGVFIWENEYHIISEFNISKISSLNLIKILDSFIYKDNYNIVVHVVTSPQTAMLRSSLDSKEKRPVFFKMTEDERLRSYESSFINQKKIVGLLRGNPNFTVVQVFESDSKEEALEKILNSIYEAKN